MGTRIKVRNSDEFANTVKNALAEYAADTEGAVKTAVKKAAKTVKDEIRKNAPVRAGVSRGKYASGSYAKSWQIKVLRDNAYCTELVVYSPTQYSLAHLLENGHAKVNGGRVRAIPHIKPAEELGISQLTEEIERIVKG